MYRGSNTFNFVLVAGAYIYSGVLTERSKALKNFSVMSLFCLVDMGRKKVLNVMGYIRSYLEKKKVGMSGPKSNKKKIMLR